MMCRVAEALEAMDDSQYEIAAMVLEDHVSWSISGLTKALNAVGASLTPGAVMAHVHRACLCYEPTEDEF